MSVERRFSKQRQIIYEAVKSSREHPDAHMVYNSLCGEHPNLSMGTVYRNLNVLTEIGLIKRINCDSQPERYDGCVAPHCHFLCKTCNELYDLEEIEADFLEDIQKLLMHKITDCEIMLHGECINCVTKNSG